jgi:hypothetical protein
MSISTDIVFNTRSILFCLPVCSYYLIPWAVSYLTCQAGVVLRAANPKYYRASYTTRSRIKVRLEKPLAAKKRPKSPKQTLSVFFSPWLKVRSFRDTEVIRRNDRV